jgi:preprotein translocase subunit SecA
MLFADKLGIEEVLNQISSNNTEAVKTIQEKREKMGEENFLETVRRISLYTTDTLWMEHIEAMDYLRSSVNLRAYGQREPIVEYKKEGLRMFREMEEVFKGEVLSLISNINTENITVSLASAPEEKTEEKYITNHDESKSLPKDNSKEIGRNDLCTCGSGKKYKKCHGA